MIATTYYYRPRMKELRPTNPTHPIYSIRTGSYSEEKLWINAVATRQTKEVYKVVRIEIPEGCLHIFQVLGTRYFFVIPPKTTRKIEVRIQAC